jgi:hypothetical protein
VALDRGHQVASLHLDRLVVGSHPQIQRKHLYGPPAVALADGVHSADVVLNILARRRDPGPSATILTPEALRLRHLPIADCARYDRLRRAG